MIKLVNLSKIYNKENNVSIGLQNVNLEMTKKEFIGIIGSSGSGKTTLLNVITGMDTYEEGELILFGNETSSYKQEDFEKYRRSNVSFIFQNYQLIDSYSALDNVVMELLLKGMNIKEARVKALEILEKVNMTHRIKTKASKLSGGEKQRVVIARALASDCQILACDEPTGNLDSKNSTEIVKLLKELASDKLVLFVTHDKELIEGVATRFITVKDGNIISDEVVEEIPLEEDSSSLKEVKSTFKNRMYLGLKTILSTPRKTILLLLVLMVFALGINITTVDADIYSSQSHSNDDFYYYTDDTRLIVYNSQTDEDISKYTKGSVVIENDYYLDYKTKYAGNDFYAYNATCMIENKNIDLVYGRLPKDESEVVISLDDYTLKIMDSSDLDEGKEIEIEFNYNNKNKYTVVGVTKSKLNDIVYFDQSYEAKLKENIGINLETFGQDIILKCDDQVLRVEDYRAFETFDITLPMSYKGMEVSLSIGEYDIDLSKYNVGFSDETKYCHFSGDKVFKEFTDSVVYRTTYDFSNHESAKEAYNNLKELGVNVIYPYDFDTDYDDGGVDYLLTIISAILKIVTLAINMLIVSLIINFILRSSIKDYTIMRIIGLSKNDILQMLMIQMVGLSLFSYALVGIIIAIFNQTPYASTMELDELISMLKTFDAVSKTIFILIISGVFYAYRHHKKMFKNSASQNLKGGDLL